MLNAQPIETSLSPFISARKSVNNFRLLTAQDMFWSLWVSIFLALQSIDQSFCDGQKLCAHHKKDKYQLLFDNLFDGKIGVDET